jgi:ketosteroid isomerase-like protein
LGETDDLILRLYQAFRRQDLDELIDGMHPDARFKAVPSARTYVGRDEIRQFFENDIDSLAEFDFRVVNVQAEGDRALIHGRNRIREDGDLHDAPIYWVGQVRDGMLHRFDPFTQIEEATAVFRGETTAGP